MSEALSEQILYNILNIALDTVNPTKMKNFMEQISRFRLYLLDVILLNLWKKGLASKSLYNDNKHGLHIATI